MNQRDLLFIIRTLMPGRADLEQVADNLAADPNGLKRMLDDDRLFQRLMGEEDVLLQVSPWLFFTVLLRRTWHDLERESFTVEQRSRQKVILFDTDRVVRLLAREPVREYLAALLASFTRVDSVTVLVQGRRGAWRGYRTNEFDIEGMMRYSETLDEPFRFAPYKRMGDACLFLTGVFPEFIYGQYRYPLSGRLRPRARGRLLRNVEDYEAYGRAFYQRAAEHEVARREGLDEVLALLAENFILAKKPLSLLATRYLRFTRHNLFEL